MFGKIGSGIGSALVLVTAVLAISPSEAAEKNKQTLGSLSCSEDQIAVFDGAQWVCATSTDSCPAGMLRVATLCVDIYEASVWNEEATVQYGVDANDYPCSDDASDCGNIFARSLPGVFPSRYVNWFQAQQACANVGKRLPTNAEWQLAVAGSPDSFPPGGCNAGPNSSGQPVPTDGSAPFCQSRWGMNDMVGNLSEWVTDWQQTSSDAQFNRQTCETWSRNGFTFSDDLMCLTTPDSGVRTMPMALVRGHSFEALGTNPDTSPGPFSLDLEFPDSNSRKIGFRCVQ